MQQLNDFDPTRFITPGASRPDARIVRGRRPPSMQAGPNQGSDESQWPLVDTIAPCTSCRPAKGERPTTQRSQQLNDYLKSGIVAPIIYFFDSQVRHIDQVFRALRYFEKQTDPNSTQCTIQWEIDRARR